MEKKTFTYKDSGVDIKAGEELVHSIKDLVKETHGVEVLSNIGGFGGLQHCLIPHPKHILISKNKIRYKLIE